MSDLTTIGSNTVEKHPCVAPAERRNTVTDTMGAQARSPRNNLIARGQQPILPARPPVCAECSDGTVTGASVYSALSACTVSRKTHLIVQILVFPARKNFRRPPARREPRPRHYIPCATIMPAHGATRPVLLRGGARRR
jgi:hypothetical protein